MYKGRNKDVIPLEKWAVFLDNSVQRGNSMFTTFDSAKIQANINAKINDENISLFIKFCISNHITNIDKFP